MSIDQPAENPACPEMSRDVPASAQKSVPPRPELSRDVPPRPAASRKIEKCETNPPVPRLTPRQLLAVRLFALHGMGSSQVAQVVNVDKRSVNRWKQSIPFQVELRRLHDLIVALARTSPASNRRLTIAPAPSPPRDSKDSDKPLTAWEMREMDEFVNSMLSKGR